ncbi:Serine/threonine-protein kinase LMTK2 [Triplophysa tibetana]|uniref:non-specific serine/threonine protein kinase n=1 Tax=Triplophysa tibetana TaxID=1572043 RepID=A0A5A9N8E1_9TELE|nr:Serine/threonine-protein kinase LMTK2 [Triplophysa tibetana]
MEALRGGVCVCLLGFATFAQAAPVSYELSGVSAGDVDLSLSVLLLLSLAVLLALVVLLLNCVSCCKEQEINFKEFDDHFEDEVDFTPPAEDTPSMSPAEVYTLAVPPVPLPGPPHLQLPRMTDVSSGPHVARHSLSYIQEIGSGWFGKVLLSEIYAEPGFAQVIVKELKANASSKEQNEFLQQGDPFRVLQHPNILQCLGQCVEAIPFLLVFENCELRVGKHCTPDQLLVTMPVVCGVLWARAGGWLRAIPPVSRERELTAARCCVMQSGPLLSLCYCSGFDPSRSSTRLGQTFCNKSKLKHSAKVFCLNAKCGDLKSYVSQHDWLYRNGELLQLQKMACEIAAGVTHMHKHNFLHRLGYVECLDTLSSPVPSRTLRICRKVSDCTALLDLGVLAVLSRWDMMILRFERKRILAEQAGSDLALRNCYLTTDITVKVGDYGIGPSSFKEDYITTEDDQCVALRWLAPELIGELHGGLITSEQTKPSNVWALGVTLWELFDSGKQPYPHLSDREVLHHVLKDQQIRLLKPQLDLPYSERWYEVLQFCWLPLDKRATAEEVHRLLTYLRMQGQKDVEDDFEQRWSSLKPNPITRQATISHSSFPILEQFDDGREPDEMLTVTETSRGLSFEYVWEAAKHDHYESHSRSSMDNTLNYHSMFFPVPRQDIHAQFPDTEAKVPETLTVFDPHKASSGNEYFIKLEELEESDVGMDESQGAEGTNPSEQQQYMVLRDVRLDESSTDADFFHQSIDSKDSYLQDSHIWSSSEHESPYHTNIFGDGDSKFEDSHSFRGGFMEMKTDPEGETNGTEAGNTFHNSFLGFGPEAVHLEVSDQESADVMKLLNTDKLTENFLFLKDNGLLKDQSASSLPGPVIETNVSDSVNLTGASFKSADNCMQLKDEFLDLVSPILEDFLSPLKGNESTVPLDRFITGETCSNLLPDTNGSLLSPKASSSKSTSESVEVIVDSPSDSHQSLESATTVTSCIDAKPPSLEECFETSKENGQDLGIGESTLLSFTATESSVLTDGLSNELMRDIIMEQDKTMSEDIPPLESIHQDETLLANSVTQDMSSVLVSETSLDQLSQDSLLDDSTLSTLPTIENSAETPDSLDSLDIHRDVVQSLATPVNELQPPYKAADSGYETENLESPEWNSQAGVRDLSEESSVGVAVEPTALVPPEIVVSEVDSVPDVQVNGDDQRQPGDVPLSGNYRDSAYFSDNEELDRKSDDVNGSAPAVETLVIKELSASETSSEGPTPESANGEAKRTPLPELILSTEEDWSQDKMSGSEFPDLLSDQTHSHEDPEHAATSSTSTQPSADLRVHAKLTRTYAGEGTKKESDMEGRYLGKIDGSSLEYGPEDGMDADEEDENSDESDDDVRAYRLHSSSSECSEDDVVHPVPVIISEDSSSLNLKSLLKPIFSRNTKATTEEGSDRRGVSFFDDVTVYLFDQETPTKELGEHALDPGRQVSDFSSPVASSSYLNRFTNSESSTDEEGGAFEWDDDFPSPEPNFLSKSTSDHSVSQTSASSAASKYFSPPPVNRTMEQSWNSPSNYSRFSISPASMASFSLTHLTDSDIEQGGSGEDGEKD